MPQTKKSNGAGTEETAPVKIKPREFDLEGHEIFPVDKVEEAETLEETEETEEVGETPELDDEEINPFKDKWEE